MTTCKYFENIHTCVVSRMWNPKQICNCAVATFHIVEAISAHHASFRVDPVEVFAHFGWEGKAHTEPKRSIIHSGDKMINTGF